MAKQSAANREALIIGCEKGVEWESGAYGGLFWHLAAQVINCHHGLVCAPSFVDGEVRHVLTDDLEHVLGMQGSRGILGRVSSAYPGIRKALQSGSTVLFVGTPCQILNMQDGCHESIKHGSGRLITLESACLGLADPFFFAWYLQAVGVGQEQVANVTVQTVVLHEKRSFVTTIQLENGRSIMCDDQHDLYGSSYAQGLTLKEKCYGCELLPTSGTGDLTIAPYSNGLAGIAMTGPQAAATLIINTERGARLWEEVKQRLAFQKVSLMRERAANPYLSQRPIRPSNKDQFDEDVRTLGLEELAARYTGTKARPKLLRSLVPWLGIGRTTSR